MKRHLRPLLILVFVFTALGVLLFASLRPGSMPDTATKALHVGDLVTIPRRPLPLCKDLIDPVQGPASLHLFLEGLDSGITALACDDDLEHTATFELRRVLPNGLSQQADEAAWSAILGHPLRERGKARVLRAEIRRAQDAGGTHLATDDAKVALRIFQWWAPITLVVVLFVWGLMIYLGAHTSLVRDAAPGGTALERQTYSLGKTQFAWWFAIIFASLGFLWLVTGEVPGLSPQALALLGMSGATTGLSLAVAPGRLTDDGRDGVFFYDLVSDAQGVTIHRFQMFVMTVALGLVFLYEVITRLTMPTFDASLLTLMGLSSVAYVGLKIPEGSTSPPSADPKAGYSPAATSALPTAVKAQ